MGDTVMLAAILLGGRYLILSALGASGWAGWTARWLRRLALVSVLLLGLRLFTIAAYRPDIAGIVSAIAAAILLAGVLLMVADHWIVRFLPMTRRRGR
jgi:hypothetical protein